MDVYFRKCITCILNHISTHLSQNGRCASTGSNEEKKTTKKPIRLTA